MDLKSPGTRGTYVDLVKKDLKFVGSKEMSTYFVKDTKLIQLEVGEEDLFNIGTYVQCMITLGRRILNIMEWPLLLTKPSLFIFGKLFFIQIILSRFVQVTHVLSYFCLYSAISGSVIDCIYY